ncbi:MAG: hypothetical protein IJF37_07860 [Lachnospiraceae bacterium]|nr:hypothetical protein [Lachnospiraceae bacterium]
MYNENDENVVLCGANSYTQMFYFNEDQFGNLPDSIKDELKAMCVIFTEDIGGILTLEYNLDGELEFKVRTDEQDYLFDEIGCGLRIKDLQTKKRELLEALELYYKTFNFN